MSVDDRPLVTIDDWEGAARRRLSKMAYDYFRAGSDDQRTLKRNRKAFRNYEIHYRVLVDVSERDLSTTVLSTEVSLPVLVAPTAYHRLAHPDGEVAAGRGASDAGTIFTLSSLATSTIEAVAAGSTGPKWFQLYVHKDRGLSKSLVERAEAAGYLAVVLTVDAPVLGRRLADEYNRFALPEGMTMANLEQYAGEMSEATEGSALDDFVTTRHDASLTWDDLEWLRSITSLPVLIKGIVRPDDAGRAFDSGAAGVVVSNHGGRQLDGAPATIDVLGPIAEAVRGRGTLLMDGGIRWGSDVLKALALGADAVMVGRPVLWGLAVEGSEGVRKVLDGLREELSTAMALAGCRDLASIDGDLIYSGRAPRR